jgi:uncharacterized protein YdiU (UPF0061 family)
MNPASEPFKHLRFDNSFTHALPADPESENFRRQVAGSCFSRVLPAKVAQPRLVAHAREVAELLNISDEVCQSQIFTQVFAGNVVLDGMDPYAACYGGHQFGAWAGQLGDGRAINLCELVNGRDERWTLQLKGAGPTPYSRGADGLAVLRSSLREFLCSEAMHHLGVPTTRALSLVLSGEEVVRDMFYDGRPRAEPGAIVCRVAPSFTRFGNFQIFASRGEAEVLKQLADYTIRTDFPHLGEPSPDVYVAWFAEVCQRTLDMIVHWMRVGFVHGVMNTDNMSILGLTIDYGPYGWLEDYDPNWTPNTTDASGCRYRFDHQPQIALWNLVQLANAISSLIERVDPLQAVLDAYRKDFQTRWHSMMAQKLGLRRFEVETDKDLVADLLTLLQLVETDMTIFFRKLAAVDCHAEGNEGGVENDSDGDGESDGELLSPLRRAYYQPDQLTEKSHAQIASWLRRYRTRVRQDGRSDTERREQMNSVNPKYVLRNYLAQLAIDKAEAGDPSLVHELLEVLRRPYDEQSEYEKHAEKRPEWARHRPGCSMLSCSS